MQNFSHPHDSQAHHRFGFRSVFARLLTSVFLALVVFAVAMVALAQLVHNNSDSMRSRAIATQISNQIDPFLVEARALANEGNRVQARFILAAIKRSFDIFDESLNAKIGLYDPERNLILQTQNTDLPAQLHRKPSWAANIMPALIGDTPPNVLVESHTGYIIWYESRNPPTRSPFLGIFNLFTGTLLLVVIMFAVLWWIAHSITKRINQMSQQMARLGDGDFSVRVNETGNDEIAMLARGFNQSAHKIEKLINANNLLLAHASHEFRTPITRIRLQIEMMDMLAAQLADSEQEKFKKRATAVNRDLTGLNELVESILLVSRLDAGHALQASEQVDLLALVHSECQHYSDVTLHAEPVSMTAQPKLLVHLVRNLLNNAHIHGTPPVDVYVYAAATPEQARHIPESLAHVATVHDNPGSDDTSSDTSALTQHNAPAKKPADISDDDKKSDDSHSLIKRLTRNKPKSAPEAHYAVLAIIDQGTGIAPEKREGIFSPFVRLKQEKKGSGLGLSLVAQIVEAHHGHISTDTWQGKTRFIAILPLKPKSPTAKAEPPKSDA